MKEVVWNSALATVAQNWANTCPTGHNMNRNIQQSAYASLGENMFSSSGATVNVSKAVVAWYSEVSTFKSSNIDPFVYVSGTGHYS